MIQITRQPTLTHSLLWTKPPTKIHTGVQDDHYKLADTASTVLSNNVNEALPLNVDALTGKERNLLTTRSDANPADIGPNKFVDQGGQTGILTMGWGSGTDNFTYLISRHEAFNNVTVAAVPRFPGLSMTFIWIVRETWLFNGASVSCSGYGEDYMIVDGNEGDRKNLTGWHGGDELVLAVAAPNDNTRCGT